MAEFKAFVPGIEVNGETVYSVVDGVGVFKAKALSILAGHGIVDPVKGRWYSQQAWLDSFRSIAEGVGAATLSSIGRKIPENAQFPPEIDSIVKALSAIDVAYHMNHRRDGKVMFDPTSGGMLEGIGHYQFLPLDDRTAKMICRNPYPCEFDRGIIEAMAKRFKPADSVFAQVRHDDAAPCRHKAADACTYLISW